MTKTKMITRLMLVPSMALFLSCSNRESVASESGINFVKKEGTNPNVVGKYDGKDITAADLEKASPEIFESKVRLYQAQKRGMEEYVRNMVLEGLAKKANLPMDEFMKKEMETSKKKITAKEVDEFLKKNNVADTSKVPDHVKDQVRGLLHMQKVVADGSKGNVAEIYLKRPQAPSLVIKTDGEPMWGDKDAAVTIVEFSDFQCPFCSKGKDRLNELKKMYGKKIRVFFKQFPLPMHPDARPAAEASLCVNEQGADKFWKFHDAAFEHQDKLNAEGLKEHAKTAGVDMKKFEECVAAKKYAKNVDASMEEARKLGVDSTPTFYVNSQPVHGALPVAEFKEIIDEALAGK